MKTIIIILVLTSFIYSQTVYEIPFASKGNEIELSVFNNSEINISNVIVKAVEIPNWIEYIENEKELPVMSSKSEGIVTFKFDVAKEAKLMEENTLIFQVISNNQTWNKEIKITVLPPDKFELNQNYPNPFNPTTTISYTIPGNLETHSHASVQLIIFDILGSEVETLVRQEQSPGFYKVEWNANNYASGMYVYQINIKGKNSKSEVLRKKMMLLR